MPTLENTPPTEKTPNNLSFAPFNKLRIIKKYQNRKLYDTEQSRYCEFRDLLEWIQAGQTLRIVEQKTNKDISSLILAKIWWQAQAQLLKNLEEEKTDLNAFWHKHIRSAKNPWSELLKTENKNTADQADTALGAHPKAQNSSASA